MPSGSIEIENKKKEIKLKGYVTARKWSLSWSTFITSKLWNVRKYKSIC